MSWLFEDPTPVLVGIIVVEAILGAFYVSTLRKEFLWAILGMLVPLGGILLADALVVTDREAIQATISEGVAALEANDLERALKLVSPSAREVRQLASWAMAVIKFTSIHVSDVQISINHLQEPPTAEVRFFAVCRYEFKQPTQEALYDAYAGKFRVVFQKIDGKWLLTDQFEYETANI